MTDKKMKTFSIKIPTEMYEEMGTVASENERNMSQEGRRALELHIKKHKQKKRLAAK